MMTALSRRRRQLASDEGVALLLALIFIGVVGALVAALLPYAQAGTSEAAVARDVRSTQNAADGAVEGAIEQVRPSLVFGSSSTSPCPDYVAPVYPTVVGSTTTNTSVTVTCQHTSGFGGGNLPDVPPYAIIATQGGVSTSGNNTLSVVGGMYANGSIGTTGGSATNYLVTGDVFTTPPSGPPPADQHTCTNVNITPGAFFLHCPAAGTDPTFPDVNYPTALGSDTSTADANISSMLKDPLGKCDIPGVVRFKPGYYSQAPQPDTATPSASDPDACGSTPPTTWLLAPCSSYTISGGCSGSVPGVYYLDFPDASYANYSNSAVWDLDSLKVHLISGSLVSDWASQPDGKKCDQNPTALGTQIVLGGPTQITTGVHSSIELCASATDSSVDLSAGSPLSQHIALYGLSHNSAWGLDATTGPRAPATTTDAPAGNAADTPGTDSAWALRDGAKQTGDGTVATAAFTGTVKTYGVDLSNYANVTGGSLIEDAVLHVRHYETATSGNITPSITVSYGDNTPSDTCPLSSGGTAVTPRNDTIDLFTDCTKNTLKSANYRWKSLNGLKVTYEAAGTKQGSNQPIGTAGVDGVQVQATIVTPAREAERCQSGETACYAYSNSSSTATDNTYFIGTSYTPSMPLNVVVHNLPNTIFNRGVVASSLLITANASSKQSDSPFSLPHTETPKRAVLFTARITGTTRQLVRAVIVYTDCVPAPRCAQLAHVNDPGNAAFPGRLVQVARWTASDDLKQP